MTKVVVRLPEPKKEYSEDNQRQINRALNTIIEQLNSTYLTQLKRRPRTIYLVRIRLMANIYKNDKVSLTTTDVTTLYTVPSNSRAIVKSLLVAEDAAGSAVVKVTLTNAAGTAFVVDNDVTLTSGQKEQVLSEPLIMQESEILKVQATSGNVDVIASILEINREDR